MCAKEGNLITGGRESAEVVRERQLRWRREHPKAWRQMRAAQKRRYYEQSRNNDRRKGIRWTEGEDARIIASDRPSDRTLSKALDRSMHAIQQRRSCLTLRHI
jgi:hypothetical protein